MDPTNNIATDLFYKVRSRFSGLKLGTAEGTITINPEEARFFDFDYKDGNVAIGHVSISLAEENSMKVYFSTGITESMDDFQKRGWYGFLKELRNFAKRRLMAFDTRDIAKDNLDKRDYAFLSQSSTANKSPVGESIMNESQLYGTRTMSFQKLMDTRLIIKHSKTLQDDQQPGARSRNISALFVENQDGERFKYPFIHLAGARAMQRHVANGGLPYDDLGKSIISMSEQIAQLKSFSNYVVRNDLMNSNTNDIVERSHQALGQLREQIARLAKQGYYEQYKESFQAQQPLEVPQSVVEEFKDKFTVKSFREELESVFPILYRLMQEENTVDYEDIVSMSTESINDEADIDLSEDHDEFAKFEDWVMGLGESSPLQSDEDQLQAIEDLNKMIAQAFPAGVDGTNAIQSLKGIIEDPNLYKEIKDAARQNPQEDVRPMIKAWVDENAATIADQLDFGDMEQAAAEPEAGTEEPAAAEPATDDTEASDAAAAGDAAVAAATGGGEQTVTQSDDNVSRGESKKINVKELAEFIQSFYDRESGTFPKGPEGVCTMVGKKFGEQAESVARKFVERMAPMQTTKNNPELQELARIRELAGMPNNDIKEASSSAGKLQVFDIKKLDGSSGRGTAYLYDEQENETMVSIEFDVDDQGAEITSIRDKKGNEIDPSSVEYDEDSLYSDILDFQRDQRDVDWDVVGDRMRDDRLTGESSKLSRMQSEASSSTGKLQAFDIKKLDGGSGRGIAYLYDEQGKETMVIIEFDVDDQGVEITSIQDKKGIEIDPSSVEYDEDSLYSDILDFQRDQRDVDWDVVGDRMRDDRLTGETSELARIRELAGMPNNDIKEAVPSAGKLQVFDIKKLDGGSGRGIAYLYDEQGKETMVSIEFDVDDQGAEITSIRDKKGNEIDPDSVEYDEDSLFSDILEFQRDQRDVDWDVVGDRMRDDRLTGESSKLSRMQSEAGGYDPDQHPQTKDYGTGDEEGVEDLLAAIEEEMNDPGKHIDNLQDVMNATIDADDSPEYEKARAVINRYLELVTNADVDHYDDDDDDPSAPAIGRMAHGDIARHIREYDLGDYLAHASHMLTKVAGQGESFSPELEDIRRLSGIAQGLGY